MPNAPGTSSANARGKPPQTTRTTCVADPGAQVARSGIVAENDLVILLGSTEFAQETLTCRARQQSTRVGADHAAAGATRSRSGTGPPPAKSA
jgi:hypothetical protein